MKNERSDHQETEFNPGNGSDNQKTKNEEIKESIERRITRSMSNELKTKHVTQAIAIINNLIVPASEKVKLKMIAQKLYQSIQLTQEEKNYWNSFSNCEKSYILTGDSAQSLDFTEYQSADFSVDFLPQEEQIVPDWQEQNLYFEPSSSDSDTSEDPEYVQPEPTRKTITTSDESWPETSNSQGFFQPSSSKTLGDQQETNRDSSSASSSDSEPPRKTVTTQKNKDSWKSTDSKEWKPTRKPVIIPDPESIATRTRSKHVEDVDNTMASHPHDLNIDSVCCDQRRQELAKPSSGIQKNWALCYKCALSPRKNPGQPD